MASQVHTKFIQGPMGSKDVKALAGIGDAHGQKFIDAGYALAKNVFGVYLKFKRDRQQFTEWVKKTCDAGDLDAAECYNCLEAWERQFPSVRDFLDKVLTDLPNVDQILLEKLKAARCPDVKSLVVVLLLSNEDQGEFTTCLRVTCLASKKQAATCYNEIKGWSTIAPE